MAQAAVSGRMPSAVGMVDAGGHASLRSEAIVCGDSLRRVRKGMPT
jgi:hypothetical protein